jgi:hypothetical protein
LPVKGVPLLKKVNYGGRKLAKSRINSVIAATYLSVSRVPPFGKRGDRGDFEPGHTEHTSDSRYNHRRGVKNIIDCRRPTFL